MLWQKPGSNSMQDAREAQMTRSQPYYPRHLLMRKIPNATITMGSIIMIAVHIMIAITAAAGMKPDTAIHDNIQTEQRILSDLLQRLHLFFIRKIIGFPDPGKEFFIQFFRSADNNVMCPSAGIRL